MDDKRMKLFSLVGMVLILAFATIKVLSSDVHEVKQALPSHISNLSEVKSVEIKDANGQLILSGNFGNATQDGKELEREAVLAATTVIPAATGVAEIEISTGKASFIEQELELSVKHLSAGTIFHLFVDSQEVAPFKTNHEGKAELEFTNKPLK